VVGTDDARARAVLAEIYQPFYLNAAPILYVSRRTAELIKYASNAFLATKITFINEMADLCEQVGADVQDVARGMGLDNGIGAKFLHAGPGFGGWCLPKDTVALIKTAHDHGVQLRPVEAGGSLLLCFRQYGAQLVQDWLGCGCRAVHDLSSPIDGATCGVNHS
jgi:UDPglucose 6-dehydrogenase